MMVARSRHDPPSRIWRSPPASTNTQIMPTPASYLRARSLIAAPLRPAAPAPAMPADRAPAAAYRPGDPAIRVIDAAAMPAADADELIGAVVVLSGVRDGEHEQLLHDVGLTRLRSFQRLDDENGTFATVFARRQLAASYRAVLDSIRYVNRAARPTPGPRRVTVQIVDRRGTVHEFGAFEFAVDGAAAAAAKAPARPAPPIAPGRGGIVATDGGTVGFIRDIESFASYWWRHVLIAPATRRRRPATEPA
jgi:hypothetical protein